MMPGEDGLSLTRYLRENFTIGILILTGKGEPVDRVVGLEMGADDYLAKPFNLRELLARVRSISRRIESTGRPLPRTAIARPTPKYWRSTDIGWMSLAAGSSGRTGRMFP